MNAARRRAVRRDLDAFLSWGLSADERAQLVAEDAAYLKARAAEFAAEDRPTREAEADERIYARMRAQDRAFS